MVLLCPAQGPWASSFLSNLKSVFTIKKIMPKNGFFKMNKPEINSN